MPVSVSRKIRLFDCSTNSEVPFYHIDLNRFRHTPFLAKKMVLRVPYILNYEIKKNNDWMICVLTFMLKSCLLTILKKYSYIPEILGQINYHFNYEYVGTHS